MNTNEAITLPFTPHFSVVDERGHQQALGRIHRDVNPIPIGTQAEATWGPQDLPYVNALLSSIRLDRAKLELRQSELQAKLGGLTHQFAATTTELSVMRDLEARIEESLNESKP